MRKVTGFLLTVEHTAKNQTTMRLSFKNSATGRAFRGYFVGAEPYFYITPKGDLNETKSALEKVEVKKFDKLLKVVRVEVVEKSVNFEKTKVLKVFAKNPSDVPDLSEACKAYGDRFEYNIPFVKRFMADYYFTPFEEYDVELDENKIIKSIKPTNSHKPVSLSLLSIDLETHTVQNKIDMKKDPIIMISWANDKRAGVISYEHKFTEKYVESYVDEKEAIEKLTELVRKEKPDAICTYNGDQFDLPYLRERAKKVKADLRLGRTKKLPFSRAAGIRTETSLDGRIHFDVFPVISFMDFIGAFKVTRLKLETVYKEVLGKEKVDVVKSDIATTWDKGPSKELDFLARYNKEDAEACQELARYALPLQIEMCKITGNDLFKNSRATAINLVEPVLMKLARDRNEIFRSKPKFEGEGEPIKGAFVKLPEPGVYSNIAVLDFKSLYPSIIISHNISVDTINCACCTEKESYVSPNGDRFCKKHKGIIPDMLSRVLTRRFEIQKQMKQLDKKSSEYQQLYNQQWALKILANSTYGLMANERFRYYSRAGAEAVTGWAREYIQNTIKQAEDAGFKVLYSDTDSTFLQYTNEKSVLDFAKEVNSKLPEQMQLELEDFYPRGIFVSKKHDKGATGAKKKYAMINKEGKIKIRGFELVRRDWSKVARDTQKHVLELLLKEGDVQAAVKFVRSQIEKVKGGKMPIEEFVIYTELRKKPEDYEILSPEVAAYKKAVKAGLSPSTVVAYVVTASGKSVSDRAQVVELAKDYDASYYIENQLLPAVLKILGELGITEDDLLTSSTQKGLGGW